MKIKKINVGIIGNGVVGKRRAHFIKQNKNYSLKYISDISFKKDTKIKGIHLFKNYNKIISLKPDAVFVTLPNYLAAKVTKKLLMNGIHVFCEKPPGKNLSEIIKIDMTEFDKRILNTSVRVACDVTNPLCGNEGASAIFGPQKGATPTEVSLLDNNLLHWSKLIKDQLGKNILNIPGAGAAGGLGAGLMAFTNAELSIGANIVLEALEYENNFKDVDLVIVGEGRTDKSTQFNKSPVAVSMRAKKKGIPVLCLSGSLGEGYTDSRDLGITTFFSIVSGPTDLKYAIDNAYDLIVQSTEEIIRSVLI